MMNRKLSMAAIGAVLGTLVVSSAAWGQAVLQSVAVRVNPGQEATYRERVDALQKVMDRVGGTGKLQIWNATLAGTNAGTSLVVVSYPSLAAYAETTTKTSADPEWQKIFGGLHEVRTLISQSLLVSSDGGGMPPAAASGAVLQGVLVRVKPGQLDTYLQRIEALKAAQERVGSSGTLRVWQASLAGEMAGTIAVGITHPSLAAYAENTTKLQGDAEAQKLLEGLDAIRTVVSRSLYTSP